MNKARLVATAIVVLAVLIAGVGTWLALYVFHPGRVSHAEYLPPNNAIRIALQPFRVQSRVSDLVPTATRFIKQVPKFTSMQGRPFRIDWIHHLPYEFTFLLQQDTPDALGVRLYVNEKPDMKSFVSELNNSGFFGAVRGVVWNPPRLHAEGQTSWMTDGSMPLPTHTQEYVRQVFGNAGIPDAVDYTGEHFFEMTGVNNAGAFLEFHGSTLRNWGAMGGDDLHDALSNVWPHIARAHITGDWIDTDRMDFKLELVLSPSGDAATVMAAHDLFLSRLDAGLQAWQGMNLTGSAKQQNSRLLVGNYTLRGFEAALQRALRIR